MRRRLIPSLLPALLALALAFGAAACKRDPPQGQDRAPAPAGPGGAAPGHTGPPAAPAPPPAQAPVAEGVPIPAGPAVAAPLLREVPSEAECAAACDRLVAAEARPWVDGVGDAAKADLEQLVADLGQRERPACVRRCRASLSRAATACVLATADAAAAVDCLARTGLVGPATP